MKSLDMDIASTYFRDYDTCKVRLEFTGGYQKGKSQGNNPCKVTVPYSSFSKKLQTIQRLGGKIISVSILDGKLTYPQISSTVVETKAIVPEPELAFEPEMIAPELEIVAETEVIAPEIISVVETEVI
ncbi:MAG: phycobilisome linker polypeptide, partial [Pseudanabaena sp.]